MGRYLLDTNIVAFFISDDKDNLSFEVYDILTDYNNQLYISAVSVLELLQLYRIKKITTRKYKTANELYQALEKVFYIEILPFIKEHTDTLSNLKIADGHNDPFDHSIIAHAITEKFTLVSSDRKFEEYISQKLKFVFNKR
ncbi:MAG: type II toxin-antitoxin system VapC family toxin [Flavobacteriaceae bacterium]